MSLSRAHAFLAAAVFALLACEQSDPEPVCGGGCYSGSDHTIAGSPARYAFVAKGSAEMAFADRDVPVVVVDEGAFTTGENSVAVAELFEPGADASAVVDGAAGSDASVDAAVDVAADAAIDADASVVADVDGASFDAASERYRADAQVAAEPTFTRQHFVEIRWSPVDGDDTNGSPAPRDFEVTRCERSTEWLFYRADKQDTVCVSFDGSTHPPRVVTLSGTFQPLGRDENARGNLYRIAIAAPALTLNLTRDVSYSPGTATVHDCY
jgi:hypothetical protein